jgi:hypothetical protein
MSYINIWLLKKVNVCLEQIKNTYKMELLNYEIESQAIEHTYTIQHHFEGTLVYKEWIDSKDGKCLDFILRSKDGLELNDPALVEEVQDFVDVYLKNHE